MKTKIEHMFDPSDTLHDRQIQSSFGVSHWEGLRSVIQTSRGVGVVTESLMEKIPAIEGFPTDFGAVPDLHRGLLALIEAQSVKSGRPVDWIRLIALVKEARQRHLEPYTIFAGRNLVPAISTVVNDLRAYGLISGSSRGFELSEQSRAELENWNGQFRALVAQANTLV